MDHSEFENKDWNKVTVAPEIVESSVPPAVTTELRYVYASEVPAGGVELGVGVFVGVTDGLTGNGLEVGVGVFVGVSVGVVVTVVVGVIVGVTDDVLVKVTDGVILGVTELVGVTV